MNLTTRYLGLDLAHPFLPGASPLSEDPDMLLRLEDAGAPAVVLSSLFEEQVVGEEVDLFGHHDVHAEGFAEATSFLPPSLLEGYGPEEYLERVRTAKDRLSIPVIASLNGVSDGGWLRYARDIQSAGADALELNVYDVPTDPNTSAEEVEARLVGMVQTVVESVEIPVAVKLSSFYTSLPNLARKLQAAGARGLVLFNRFYQPDLDAEELEVRPQIRLSDSSELLLRLRWIAVLSPQLEVPIALTGGAHTATDLVKGLMSGARVVQLVSALLREGPEALKRLRLEVERWMVEHDYESLAQLRGCMNLERCPDPHAFERANYVRLLRSY